MLTLFHYGIRDERYKPDPADPKDKAADMTDKLVRRIYIAGIRQSVPGWMAMIIAWTRWFTKNSLYSLLVFCFIKPVTAKSVVGGIEL